MTEDFNIHNSNFLVPNSIFSSRSLSSRLSRYISSCLVLLHPSPSFYHLCISSALFNLLPFKNSSQVHVSPPLPLLITSHTWNGIMNNWYLHHSLSSLSAHLSSLFPFSPFNTDYAGCLSFELYRAGLILMQARTWPTSTELTDTRTKMHSQKKAVYDYRSRESLISACMP